MTKGADCLAIKVFGETDEFNDLLQRVKVIPGRRWNPDGKVWELPDDADTLMRVIQSLQPELDAETQAWVKETLGDATDTLLTDMPDDATLVAEWAQRDLYPFQRADVNFFVDHPHSINALEMGLGKTLEAIATVEETIARKGPDDRPRLVVCPSKLRGNWAKEIHQWLGDDEPVFIIDGPPAKRAKQLEQALAAPRAWVVVNWEKLRILPDLAKVDWLAVIADEAHRAKNRKAKQTKALWKLKGDIQLAMTGTPIQNSPDELWSLLRWIRPEQYAQHTAGGGFWNFWYTYVESYETKYKPVVVGVKNADKLRFELKDKMVRRTKDQVLDLPEKTVTRIPVELNPGQRKMYDKAENDLWLEIEQAYETAMAAEDLELANKIAAASDEGNAVALTQLIPNGAALTTRLRQIASTPALLGGDDDSAKLDAAVEVIADAAEGKQFVVFSWFEETTSYLQARLEKLKPPLKVDRVTGKTGDPTDTVAAFQAGDIDVLCCTIAAGGVGLTLTAADTAIFLDRDWTPAVNEQAEDRLHRNGQKNAVQIMVLDGTDTVDTKRIAPKNKLKSLIVHSVLGD